jgi:hypothetical protein
MQSRGAGADSSVLTTELQALRLRDKSLSEELATLRSDSQKWRAAEAAYELQRSQEESKAAATDKKMNDLGAKLAKAEEKLLKTEKSLLDVTLKHDKSVALEGRVEHLGRMLRHHLAQRVCGERQVRAAVGLPLRSSYSDTASKYRGLRTGATVTALTDFDGAGESTDMEMAEELKGFILRRALSGWREESGRNGSGLVHAIAVWGWRRTLEAAEDLAALVDSQIIAAKPKPDLASAQASRPAAAAGQAMNGAAISAVFSAKRALASARGFAADFAAHAPSDAAHGT